jgi:hypothetical protein
MLKNKRALHEVNFGVKKQDNTMKAQLTKSLNDVTRMESLTTLVSRSEVNKFFAYSAGLALLFVMVFATVSTFAQAPVPAKAIETQEVQALDFAKQTIVFNSGKVYLNWIAKSDAPDCIYIVERSVDGKEYEPVGLKEGIHSPLELLYSWVDTKPLNGEVQYRIKQINEEGRLMAVSASQKINPGDNNPLFLEKGTRMVSAH